MRKNLLSVIVTAAAAAILVPTTGCPFLFPPNDNSNSNTNGNSNSSNNGNSNSSTNSNSNSNNNTNNNSGGGNFSPVKTDIEMHVQGRIAAGDDLIVFGTGGFFGVDYIVPSSNPTAGAGLPNGNMFQAGSFAVAGKNIALVNNFQVTIYDTESDTSTTFPSTDIRLINVPIGLDAPGHIQADGDFVVTRNDDGEVTDGKVIKVIDLSTPTPTLISFDVNPTNDTATQVAVDALTRSVCAVSGDTFFIYDMQNPMNAPLMFDVSGNGGIGNDTQIAYSNRTIFYYDDQTPTSARTLDTTNVANTPMTVNIGGERASLELDMVDINVAEPMLGFFTDAESNGSQLQSVIGTQGSRKLATPDVFIDGSTTNNGVFGFAQTIQVDHNGARWWAAGSESVGSGEYLMVSTGGDFTILPDPTGDDQYGCPGTDVRVSDNTVAFKTGNNSDTVVGYIILGN